MKERYARNLNAISSADMDKLNGKKICVVGCGGLGGHIIETMARIAAFEITVVDCDVFDESNLNRQLLSTEANIGQPKANAAAKRIAAVNSDAGIHVIAERLVETNCDKVLKGHDLVLDALDNIPSRLLLAETCRRLGIPLVHGSIGGWYGQVASVFPGDGAMETLYANASGVGPEVKPGNLPFMAQAVAAFQCAEAIKILTGTGTPLSNAVLRIDLQHNDYSIIKLS